MKYSDETKFKRIVIVAYRLPFKLVKKKSGFQAIQNSGGLVSAILSLAEKKDKTSKIVWVGTGEEELGNKDTHPDFDLYPVTIPSAINDKYYGGFCNETIWPLFHYFPSRTVFEPSYFEAYNNANTLFFQKLKDIIEPGDFIWVHDYQLFLLPEMIRKAFPSAQIGFFLHIPFPSFELFRLLPTKWREQILSGMTGADTIGFHTNDYTQHFIKSVKRTLGYKVERNYIMIDDRLCKADTFPIGIDYDKFHNACVTKKTINCKNKLRSHIGNNKLVFSIDRLDYSKGFLYRLKAYERFLEKYPEWHYKVIFNMIVIPSRDNIYGYRKIKKEIEATVGRINGRYNNLSWIPITYQYKSIPFNELVAIYNTSDVGLITPVRDGMNLVAKEYIACQQGHYGMLILSEMAGAASELSEAIIISPTDADEIADSLNRALTMPEEEKEIKVQKMQNRLSRYNVFTWTKDFFNQVQEVKREQDSLQSKYMDATIMSQLKEEYKKTDRHLLMFDYDGTLTPIANTPEMAVLSETIRDALKKIISDKNNVVVIISGRNKEFLDKQFNGLNAILVAEHGYYIKYPDREWNTTVSIDLSWKSKVLPLMDDYVDKCSGSVIEEKQASLAWHYRNAEDEIISLRINDLRNSLSSILKSEDKLQIMEGDKVLEIKSMLYDKGTIAATLLRNGSYDFVLAAGDDRTDEDLFRALPENGITIKVGAKPTNARFNIRDQRQIAGILNLFVNE